MLSSSPSASPSPSTITRCNTITIKDDNNEVEASNKTRCNTETVGHSWNGGLDITMPLSSFPHKLTDNSIEQDSSTYGDNATGASSRFMTDKAMFGNIVEPVVATYHPYQALSIVVSESRQDDDKVRNTICAEDIFQICYIRLPRVCLWMVS